ncbi:hypothetical protein I4F81_007131 [Pyropia yezoensis]|uniref:Uncharacterized protein n=1 Tax=Pyropia yezoensis TaxID=2788 RepID=A0ACC3C2R8_PYRYE|nr:hypothetical protein I4F81_007131 [Neopyropia yezoensis]
MYAGPALSLGPEPSYGGPADHAGLVMAHDGSYGHLGHAASSAAAAAAAAAASRSALSTLEAGPAALTITQVQALVHEVTAPLVAMVHSHAALLERLEEAQKRLHAVVCDILRTPSGSNPS